MANECTRLLNDECIRLLNEKIKSLLEEVDVLSKAALILKVDSGSKTLTPLGGCPTTLNHPSTTTNSQSDLIINPSAKKDCCCPPTPNVKQTKPKVKQNRPQNTLRSKIEKLITKKGPMLYRDICKALPQHGANSISAILSQNFKKGPQDPKSRGVLWKL